MKVLDDDGNECPPGVVGEIYMRPAPGSAPTYRYIGATAKSRDGWDSLGDLGYFDADGFLYLNDRRVDMFTVGGRNVYPAEIESALSAHPDVLSCLVVGVPDEDLGQVPYAIVQADGTRRGGRHRVPRRAHRRLQGAAHRRVHRHPAARRRGQGAPVGRARRGHRAAQPSRSTANAVRNPIVVISPVRMWVSENASGTIVSAIIARIAPAAIAVITAIRNGDASSNSR